MMADERTETTANESLVAGLEERRPSGVGARRAALASRRNRLSASKRALLEKRLQGGTAVDVISVPKIERRPETSEPPLSFAQERLWFMDQLNPNSAFYNIPTAARVTGPLEFNVLQRALNEVVRRHEVLRTTFPATQGKPMQLVHPGGEHTIVLEDLSDLPDSRRESQARKRAMAEASQPFDLATGPLLRARVLRLGQEDHVVLLTVHHIVFDGWSAAIFLRELATLYTAFLRDVPSPLRDLPIQYADFSLWQREWLAGEVLQQQLAYWREQLADVPTLDLPTDHRRPDAPSLRGARHSFRLPRELMRGLQNLSEQEGSTLFMSLLAGFQALLSRYSGQHDIAVGSPIAGRQRTDLEGLIGFFVNTLVMRTNLSGDPSFRELLRRVRDVCLGAYAHQDVPFEKLVQELKPRRFAGRSPLFQVLIVLQNTPSAATEAPGGLRMQRIGQERGTAKFDLELMIRAGDDSLGCTFEYALDLFEASTVERMAGHLTRLFEEAVRQPDRPLSQLTILTNRERQEVLAEWNETSSKRRPACIHDLVSEQVERTPEATAVVCGTESLTYAELDERAHRLARRLSSAGVRRESKVGICLERSPDLIVGLLGILKSGAAYVPLDPDYPASRFEFVLHDAGIDVLLTQRNLYDSVAAASASLVAIDGEAKVPSTAEDVPLPAADPDNLAYILYTSGSTGTPKGIEMTHRSLSNLLYWQRQNTSGSSAPTTLQFASANFDVSFQEIFSTLNAGGTLILVDEETRHDPPALLKLMDEQRVERLFVPFVALQHLAAAAGEQGWPASLREVITAGEQLRATPEIVKVFEASGGCRLQNQYGPTETHVVTSHVLDGRPEAWPALPPIGRPITNTRTYILDRWMNPVPVGLPGELYIGGEALARGYAARPEATAALFVPDPFGQIPGARLYKTGDICRWRVNGEIEFLGRVDHQMKVRGFRIEPGEVEDVLDRHAQVQSAVVLLREDQPGDRRLVAYVVPAGDSPPSVTELRRHLKSHLPDYMVPVAYVVLESLPLTPNGKVDRDALPQPDGSRPAIETEWVPPRNDLEDKLAAVWSDVLGIDRIGVHDDFFDLGGYSLLATEVVYRIRQTVGRSIPVATLFNAPTIARLAGLLDSQQPSEDMHWVVRLNDATGGQPVCLVQMAGADLSPYHSLAKALAPEHPVYGVKDVPDARRDFATLDEMGASYAEVIRARQPEGPYCILGWSAASALAVSVAHALEKAGQAVALVGILDGGLRTKPSELNPIGAMGMFVSTGHFMNDTFGDMPADELQHFLDGLKPMSLRERFDFVVEWARERDREILPPNITWDALEEDIVNTDMHLRLINGYAPPRIRAPLQVWWAEQNPANRRSVDWEQYTLAETHTSEVPGDHMSFLKPPSTEVIARQLKSALAALNSG